MKQNYPPKNFPEKGCILDRTFPDLQSFASGYRWSSFPIALSLPVFCQPFPEIPDRGLIRDFFRKSRNFMNDIRSLAAVRVPDLRVVH